MAFHVRIVRGAVVRAPRLIASVVALAGCVSGVPADIEGPAARPLPADVREQPSFQCLLEAADPSVPICDGRYADGFRSGGTLLPTAPVRAVSGQPWAMPGYHEPTASFDARWGGASAMERPVVCGEGCEAGTLVRFESDAGAVEVAVGLDVESLDAIALGTDVRVNLHEGLEVHRSADDALVLAVLEDHAPGFRPEERVPRRSFGAFAIEADATAACQGYTHAATWSCTKLYAVDALAIIGGDTQLRLEPGRSATFATEDGTFLVRHRYGAHRIALSPESSCVPCADSEPSVLSYEVVRVD